MGGMKVRKMLFRTIGALALVAAVHTAAYAYSGPEYVDINKKVEGDGLEYRYCYPKLDDAEVDGARADINTTVRELAQKGAMQALMLSKKSSVPITGELIYEVPYGSSKTISFVFTGFLDAGGDKLPMLRRQGVTCDLQTGLELTLDEILTGSNSLDVVSSLASQQLQAKGVEVPADLRVDANQNYYLTPTQLVLVYAPGELTPRESGIFEIRLALEDVPIDSEKIS